MTLSRREQILLAVLVILGILAIGFYLVYQPLSDKYLELQSKQQDLQLTYDTTMAEIGRLDELKAKSEALASQIDTRTQRYFPSIIQEQIVLLMNQLYADSQIQVNSEVFALKNGISASSAGSATAQDSQSSPGLQSIRSSYIALQNGTPATTEPAPAPNAAPSEEQAKLAAAALASVNSLNHKITFVASYAQAIDFVRRIEELNRSIQVKDMALAVSTAPSQTIIGPDGQPVTVTTPAGLLDCTIDLVFNAVPKLTAQDDAYEAWTLTGTYGKADPFAK